MNKTRTARSNVPVRILMAAVIIVAAGVALLARTDNAAAATQTINLNFSGSGPVKTLVHAGAVCDLCLPDAVGIAVTGDSASNSYGVGAEIDITAQATFNPAPAGVALNYNAGNLMHGKTLDLSDTLNPQAGKVTVNYSATGTVGVYETTANCLLCDEGCGSLTFPCNGWFQSSKVITAGPISDSDAVACTMPLDGDGTRTCTGTHNITLINTTLFGVVPVDVEIPITETVKVTGTAITSLRVAVISGGPAIPNQPLTFSGASPVTVADPIAISCSQPAGVDLLYSLTTNASTATSAPFSIGAGLTLDGISIFSFSLAGPDLGPIPMAASDQQADLGPVLKNNVPPIANSGGPYSGVEGSPVTFDATGSSSVCGFASLSETWNFSDGSTAYGPTPQHTFEAPGVFSGQLVLTDADGNSATSDFSVTVINLAPVANAGPNMSSEWGLPVTLNGAAVDPGTNEQSLLVYNWDFGDGSPSASGGASVTHKYAMPGTFTATFTACDPENACGTSTTQVKIVNRGTTLSYTGVTTSDVTDPATLKATLIDDQAAPVVGRIVSFYADGSPIAFASAATDGSGVASVPFPFPNGSVGTHSIASKFAGDGFYNVSQFTVSFSVTKDGTILAYTGTLTALPSKSVSLTAKLTDDMGRPLAGKVVTFTLGTQGCTATTNALGVASCTIAKLAQKPGNYFLTASFAGNGDYLASSVNIAFTVGK